MWFEIATTVILSIILISIVVLVFITYRQATGAGKAGKAVEGGVKKVKDILPTIKDFMTSFIESMSRRKKSNPTPPPELPPRPMKRKSKKKQAA